METIGVVTVMGSVAMEISMSVIIGDLLDLSCSWFIIPGHFAARFHCIPVIQSDLDLFCLFTISLCELTCSGQGLVLIIINNL
jgi:N-methylhydantoinase B/oxoprolinase/acetone carboxylase alpha subunit